MIVAILALPYAVINGFGFSRSADKLVASDLLSQNENVARAANIVPDAHRISPRTHVECHFAPAVGAAVQEISKAETPLRFPRCVRDDLVRKPSCATQRYAAPESDDLLILVDDDAIAVDIRPPF